MHLDFYLSGIKDNFVNEFQETYEGSSPQGMERLKGGAEKVGTTCGQGGESLWTTP